ncbi:MAG: hypothetical protein RR243_04305, partial [Citrobacter sp.]
MNHAFHIHKSLDISCCKKLTLHSLCQKIICGIFRKSPEAKSCGGIIRNKGDWSDELFLNKISQYIYYILEIS